MLVSKQFKNPKTYGDIPSVYKLVKIHCTTHLKKEHYIVCKLHLNKLHFKKTKLKI